MPLPLLASAATSLIPAAFKIFSGLAQNKRAKAMKPIDPGYQMNSGVIDNARILGDRANNFQMQGYNQALQKIQTTGANNFNRGLQGASSSGDVLDLVTKVNNQEQDGVNNLATQNAIGAEQAKMQSLNANVQMGQEYQNKNKYDIDLYNRALAEKAALLESSNANTYGGIDKGASVASDAINPKKGALDNADYTADPLGYMQRLLMQEHKKRLANVTPDTLAQ